MARATLRNAVDTWVDEVKPSQVMADNGFLYVRGSGTGTGRNAWVWFNSPVPLGATVLKATLWVSVTSLPAESGRYLLARAATSKPTPYSRMTWANQPAATTDRQVSTSIAGALTFGQKVGLDVTAMLQAVADGGLWWGVQLRCGSGTQAGSGIPIFSAQSATGFGPQLEVEWSDRPEQPDGMIPAAGRIVGTSTPRLSWDFVDFGGDKSMSAFQLLVMRNGSTDWWNSANPDRWSSGTVAANIPEWDWAASTCPPLAAGETFTWRVRVQDGAGLWSDWSLPQSATFQAKPDLRIAEPQPGVVVDSSPLVKWWLASGNQAAYQVIVVDVADPATRVFDSGKVGDATTREMTLPNRTLRKDGATYRFEVRVWDSLDRQTTPGVVTCSIATVEAKYDSDASVQPVTNLTAANTKTPWVKLTWNRDQVPDAWEVVRDGKVIHRADGVDLRTAPTAFAFTDYAAPAWREAKYWVRAVTNRKPSPSPKVATTSTPMGVWLRGADGTLVVLAGEDADVSVEASADQAVHQPIGNSDPVLVTSGLRGAKGSISGLLARWDVDMTTPEVVASVSVWGWRQAAERLRLAPGMVVDVSAAQLQAKVLLFNVACTPVPAGNQWEEPGWEFSADFVEVLDA